MKPEDIIASLASAPAFIHLADGRKILVNHPDAALVATRSTAVMYKNEDGEMVNALLANHLITSIELAQQSSTDRT
jgi:hypothetical protein